MKRRSWAIAAIAAAAMLLRGFALGTPSLWYDEAMYAVLARAFSWKLLSAPYILVEPLFVAPLSWWLTIGNSSFWLRLPSVFAGVLSVGIAAGIARRAAGKRAALFTAFLAICAPAMVYYSRDAKMYAWVMLWVLIAAYFALEVIRAPRAVRNYLAEARREMIEIGYIAAATALCYTHFAAPIFLAVSGVIVSLCLLRNRRRLVVWITANAIVVGLAMPFIREELAYGETMQTLVFHAAPPTPRDLLITFEHFFSAYVVSRPLSFAMLAAFTLAVLLGLLSRSAPRATRAYLFAMGPLPPIALYAISLLAHWSIYIDRYVIASAGPLIILAGIGIAGIRFEFLRGALLGALCGLSLFALPDVYANRTPEDLTRRKGLIPHMDMDGMVSAVRANAKPGDVFCHVFWETQPVFRWHLPGYTHLLADYGGQLKRALDMTTHPDYQALYDWRPQDIRGLLKPGARLWLVLPEGGPSRDLYSGMDETLRGRATCLFSGTFGEGDARTGLRLYEVGAGAAHTALDRRETNVDARNGDVWNFAFADCSGAPCFKADNGAAQSSELHAAATYGDAIVLGTAMDPSKGAESAWKNTPYLAAGMTCLATQYRDYPNGPKDDLLQADVPLSPGDYAVFIQRTVTGTNYRIPSAQIDLTLESNVLHSQGKYDERPGGWEWQRIGIVKHTSASTLHIALGASDPFHQPEGYAVFSQLVLVRVQATNVSEAAPAHEELHLSVDAHGSAMQPLTWPRGLPCVSIAGDLGEIPWILVGDHVQK